MLKVLEEPDLIRSGIAINSISQCIEELTLNSIDANSNSVAVRVDLLKAKLQVVDNGCGISNDDLKKIGCRLEMGFLLKIRYISTFNEPLCVEVT